MKNITQEPHGLLQAKIPARMIRLLRMEAARLGVSPRDIVIRGLEKVLPKDDSVKEEKRRAS